MKLNFFKPRLTPHGAFGVASLGTGGCVTVCALNGNILSPEVLQISSSLIVLNAISSIPLLSKSQNIRNKLFVQSIRIQCALAYMSVRVFYNNEFLTATDYTCFFIILFSLKELWRLSNLQQDFDFALKCGVICSASFSLYPLQFATLGSTWWSHTQYLYPQQAIGFSEYVYLPSEFVIASIMFAATLIERNLLSIQKAQILFVVPSFMLLSTVISQEIYMGSTATQELIIGVPLSNPIFLYKLLQKY